MNQPWPTTTLIVTSYNQLTVLKYLVASILNQTYQTFETLIADDGSSDGTLDFCRQLPSPRFQWITQPDQGYRKARILNEAIHRAQGDYLIFIDADVILEQHFIEDHLRLAQPHSYVSGRRVDLGPLFSKKITESKIKKGDFNTISFGLVSSALQKDTKNIKRAFRISNPMIRKLMGYHHPLDLLGSNMSLWKKDLIEINGFNEALESYWGEDGDLFIRLRNSGKISVGAKGLCIQYHLFHKRREPTSKHVAEITEKLKDQNYVRALRGYDSRFSR